MFGEDDDGGGADEENEVVYWYKYFMLKLGFWCLLYH